MSQGKETPPPETTAQHKAERTVLYKSLFTEKNGSNTKTQQRKHKYKQSENSDQVHHSS